MAENAFIAGISGEKKSVANRWLGFIMCGLVQEWFE